MRLGFSVALVVAGALGGCFVESKRHYADYYESCSQTSDCRAGADSCFLVDWIDGRGRMCSSRCDDDSDCPGWSSCYELVGDPSGARICYGRCDTHADCDPAFECTDAIMDGVVVDAICLPQGS